MNILILSHRHGSLDLLQLPQTLQIDQTWGKHQSRIALYLYLPSTSPSLICSFWSFVAQWNDNHHSPTTRWQYASDSSVSAQTQKSTVHTIYKSTWIQEAGCHSNNQLNDKITEFHEYSNRFRHRSQYINRLALSHSIVLCAYWQELFERNWCTNE